MPSVLLGVLPPSCRVDSFCRHLRRARVLHQDDAAKNQHHTDYLGDVYGFSSEPHKAEVVDYNRSNNLACNDQQKKTTST